MFGLSAIEELLVRLRLEVLAIATYILLLLSHLSHSLVIGIRPSAFGEKSARGHYTTNPLSRTEYGDI
jgi:hypothetical protein